MPFVFSHVEYCDIHFVYGFCDGNARAAVEEYQRRFPVFGAAEHISNHPDIIASATQSLLMRAENCIAAGGGHFEQLL